VQHCRHCLAHKSTYSVEALIARLIQKLPLHQRIRGHCEAALRVCPVHYIRDLGTSHHVTYGG
jgi:hypothetical protein